MFDNLNWWQLLLMITPLTAAIYGLRWREGRLKNSNYQSLTAEQRGFALLHFLPPGVSAEFFNEMHPQERQAYLKAGQGIRGNGKRILAPLVKEVVKKLTEEGHRPPTTESNDPLERLHLAAEFCKEPLKKVLRSHFPATWEP